MTQVSRHLPEFAVFTGLDPQGNAKFEVESGSTKGLWYHTIIWKDGSTGVCDCPSFERRQTCSMVELADVLLNLARVGPLVDELLSLSGGLYLSVRDDSEYTIDAETQRRIERLERQADDLLGGGLDEPGSHGAGPSE